MDERNDYGYGYAPVGERAYDLKLGRRQGRINTIAGYRGRAYWRPSRLKEPADGSPRILVGNLLQFQRCDRETG